VTTPDPDTTPPASPDIAPDVEADLDCIGLNCPLPVLRTRRRLAGLRPGDRLTVVATDPMAAIDIPHLCASDGHRLEASRRDGDRLVFVIRRGADPT
jgi:tRNA 2-thiouridine synthesizing protein A